MEVMRTLLTAVVLLQQLSITAAVLPSLHYNITEELPAGTVVGNVVLDADLVSRLKAGVLQEVRYRITDNYIATNIFTVDPVAGIIKTKAVLDREVICPTPTFGSQCVLNFDVAATRSNPDFYDVVAVTVDLQDVNDNAPSFPMPVYDLEIPESAIPPVLYNLPLAKDPDSPEHGIKKYSLESQYDNFDLNIVEGGGSIRALQLKLVKPVDREMRESYQVSVTAVDGGIVPNIGVLRVNITVADANDHVPRFLQDSYEVSVAEDTEIMSTILKVRAIDEDAGMNGRIFFSLAPASDALQRQFAVDEVTGDIVLRRQLDFESTSTYHLIIEAQDGGVNPQQAYADVTIHVSDVNDQAPSITINTLAGTTRAQVSESANPGQFVAHVSVKDTDTGPGGNFTCYSDNDQFQLRSLALQRYELVTTTRLDRETQETILVAVICTDKGSPPLSSNKALTVVVLDENDNDPVFSQETYRHDISENNRINEVILQVNATDKDLGENAEITYSIYHDPRDLVTVDSRTGLIRANAVFDYEDEHEVVFVVQAKDGGEPRRSATATVVLVIRDINDEPPRFTQDMYAFTVYENQVIGSEVGIVTAVDADSPPYNQIEYSLLQDEHLFTIDTLTGVIRAKVPLNREDISMYAIVVIATNVNVVPPLSSTATVQVDVLDVNDNPPIIDFPGVYNRSVQISNQVPVGYQVCIIQAHDIDVGDHARLHYALIMGNDESFFEMDRKTGVLVTKRSLLTYDMRTFQITVSVSDNGFPPLESQSILYIRVSKSVPYASQNTLISGTNMVIVIALSVVSSIIVVVLIVILVVFKVRDVRHRRLKAQALRYSVGNQEQDNTDSQVMVNINNSSQTTKDVNPVKDNGKQLQQSNKNIWSPSKDTKGSGGLEEQDSDSAYSGDMSNTDSGKGPSEDSHESKGPQPVSGSKMVVKPANTSVSRPAAYDPRQSYHPYYHKEYQANPRQNSIPHMIANNDHQCVNYPPIPPNKPPVNNKGKSQRTKPQVPPRRTPYTTWNNNANMNHVGNTNSLNSTRSWDTLPEEDGGSTTSGSYVVELDDATKLSSSVKV